MQIVALPQNLVLNDQKSNWLIVHIKPTDQARPKTNPCRSTHTLQSHRRNRRLRRPRRSRYQNLQRSRHRHPRCHHHRKTQCFAHSERVLGNFARRSAFVADQGEWKVWIRYCSSRFLQSSDLHGGDGLTNGNGIAHPSSPRYRPCSFPRRKASTSTRWCARRIHIFRRLYQNA